MLDLPLENVKLLSRKVVLFFLLSFCICMILLLALLNWNIMENTRGIFRGKSILISLTVENWIQSHPTQLTDRLKDIALIDQVHTILVIDPSSGLVVASNQPAYDQHSLFTLPQLYFQDKITRALDEGLPRASFVSFLGKFGFLILGDDYYYYLEYNVSWLRDRFLGTTVDAFFLTLLISLCFFGIALLFIRKWFLLPIEKLFSRLESNSAYYLHIARHLREKNPLGRISLKTLLASFQDYLAHNELRQLVFEIAVNNAPHPICLADPSGIALYINTTWSSLAGSNDENLINRGWFSGIHPEDQASLFQEWNSHSAAFQAFPLEFRFFGPEGKPVWISALCSPIFDPKGDLLGYLISGQDFTRIKETEEPLKAKNNYLDLALKVGQVGLWDWYVKSDELFVNENLASFLQLPTGNASLSFSAFKDSLHPDDRKPFEEALDAHLQGISAEFKIAARFPLSTDNWIRLVHRGKVVEFDAFGKPLRMIAACQDISFVKVLGGSPLP